MSNQGRERNGILRVLVPQLFTEPGTVLYVGAWAQRFAANRELYQAGNELTVLEIWEPWIDEMKEHPLFSERVTHWVQGDVCEVDTLELPHERYAYTVWLHGPEHVAAEAVAPTVAKLEALTNKVVVIGCPWGEFRHGKAFGNPFAAHLSHWWPRDFDALGYRYACIGPEGVPGSHILAWKVMDE